MDTLYPIPAASGRLLYVYNRAPACQSRIRLVGWLVEIEPPAQPYVIPTATARGG
jgi:hypothetical protein